MEDNLSQKITNIEVQSFHSEDSEGSGSLLYSRALAFFAGPEIPCDWLCKPSSEVSQFFRIDLWQSWSLSLSLSITLSFWGPAKKAKACRAGSHYLHYLHYELNDLNKWMQKNSSPVVTCTSSNMLSRHVPWEPHIN